MTHSSLAPETPVAPSRAGRARFTTATNGRGEQWLTGIALAITLVATLFFLQDNLLSPALLEWEHPWTGARLLLFIAVVLFLIYGNVVYQITRLGQLRRHDWHARTRSDDLERDVSGQPLVVLVPSYRENLRTIRQTLLSAALQDYPNRRVVLLIDDPVNPGTREDAALLTAARRLPGEMNALLRMPRRHIEANAARFEEVRASATFDLQGERRRLLTLYREIASWFARQANAEDAVDHTDELFTHLVFGTHQERLQEEIRRVRRNPEEALPDAESIERAYLRLRDIFRVTITSFERKRYANLSHEPNKAANLNAYLGLLGADVIERWTDGRRFLVAADLGDDEHAISIADAAYVITLDADSLISPDYAHRLISVMERPGNERLAVVQTPYTAIPGAPSQLERIAGATTDIQYLIHQGFTAVDATYWVGANALLQKSALDDIRVDVEERGYIVPRFIQDRTVIEDTESSIDLVARGWRLYNYPERLAFSATPPDFGALLIQRRRWANGGLLILPKLIRHAARGVLRGRFRPLEWLVRTHYLVSIAATSIGLLTLLFLPLGADFDSPWLPLTALPYFVLYTRDLRRIGYRRADVLRVYAFNLLLLPVNLAGVGKSIQQAITGEKIPFGRTPKTEGRTAAPAWAIAAEWMLLLACLFFGISDAVAGQWSHAAFTLVTGAGMLYALVTFIGVRESAEDMRLGVSRTANALSGKFSPVALDPGRSTE